jgi:molybdopterin biosynthesis enzyme
VPVFGLPGNPVSSRVSFEMFARPALRKLMGRRELHNPIVRATARTAFTRRADGRLHLDRVRVSVEDGRYVCERAGLQASNVLSGMAEAGGLALVPDGPGAEAGSEVEVLLLGP